MILSLLGLLFSGYLSFFRLATGECALSEPCPIFMGYPACWYGFGLFALLFAAALAAKFSPALAPAARRATIFVSAIGVVFAGQYVVPDTRAWIEGGARYDLVLPSCAYGLIFFALILWGALRRRAAAAVTNADGEA